MGTRSVVGSIVRLLIYELTLHRSVGRSDDDVKERKNTFRNDKIRRSQNKKKKFHLIFICSGKAVLLLLPCQPHVLQTHKTHTHVMINW
jgi:hypothetical protein